MYFGIYSKCFCAELKPASSFVLERSVPVAEAEKGFKEVAQLQQQLHAARKALDEAEASQGGENAATEGKSFSENIGALRDKRRRLALQVKAMRDKVHVLPSSHLL